MLPVDLPGIQDITHLMQARSDASVSIYLTSSPISREHERIRLELRNAIGEAERQLREAQLPHHVVTATISPLRALDKDPEFWRYQAHSLALFASDGALHSFRLANRVTDSVRVGDRYDVGALLRARTFPHGGYLLGLAENQVTLWGLAADTRAEQIPLALPHDLGKALEYAENQGQLDRGRARGAVGQRPERERWARIVQEHVLALLDGVHPLILTGTPELVPAYRDINTYPRLLPESLGVHPSALDADEADRRTRKLLDASYAALLEAWRERFGTERSNDRATSDLAEVAVAASTGQVSELHFDMDCDTEGTIDADGRVRTTPAGPTTYAIVDEIASRVLATGGRVAAVRAQDLTDDSPVAALLRATRGALELAELAGETS